MKNISFIELRRKACVGLIASVHSGLLASSLTVSCLEHQSHQDQTIQLARLMLERGQQLRYAGGANTGTSTTLLVLVHVPCELSQLGATRSGDLDEVEGKLPKCSVRV